MEKEFSRFGVTSSWVDTGNLEEVESALRPETKMIYVETPSNPTMRLTDLAAISEICKERGILFAVDNTFATPVLQRPLDLGADVSLHSVTT